MEIKWFSLFFFIYILISKFEKKKRTLLENNKEERKISVGWIPMTKIIKFGVYVFLHEKSVNEVFLNFHVARKDRSRLGELFFLGLILYF